MKFQKNKLLKHPLFILLLGALISSIIIPAISSAIQSKSLLRQKESEIAIEVFNQNAKVNRYANALRTMMESYAKDNYYRSNYELQDIKSEFRKDLYKTYENFNSHSWWWMEEVITKVKILKLVSELELQQLYELSESYNSELKRITTAIDAPWHYIIEDNEEVSNNLIISIGLLEEEMNNSKNERYLIIEKVINIIQN